MSDLAAAEPRLAGELKATGKITGTTDDVSMTADVGGSVAAHGMSSGALTMRIEANGLPGHPSGRITANGELLDAPIELAVALRQAGDGLAIDIERATWKSLEAGGALQLPTATMVPIGNLHVAMTRLADLTPLVGQPIAGSVRATLAASDAAALDARIDAEGVQFGGFGGTLHATARGSVDAMDVNLTAASPDLQGAPARLSAAAKVDATGQTVNLTTLQADWRQQIAAAARAGADRFLGRGHDRQAAARTAPGGARGIRAGRRDARSDRVAAQSAGRPRWRGRYRDGGCTDHRHIGQADRPGTPCREGSAGCAADRAGPCRPPRSPRMPI